MTYSGLHTANDPALPHLGGNVRGGDPFTWCPSVWRYVIDRFAIGSVLDFGSGSGTAAAFFHKQGLRVSAVDGLDENVANAVFPTIKHDVTLSPLISRFDLVHCQEVVEHIAEAYLGNLLDTLACGKVVLMTHALPGQMGHHHVNLQPPEYWHYHMSTRGFSVLEEDTRRIRSLAASENAAYMSQSGLVFGNSQRL